jgi:hypothetical protein
MSKIGWVLGAWDEVSFKQVNDGWLFAPPSVWPRRKYLVTDAQKAELSKPLRRMMWMQLGAIAVVCFLMGVFLDGRDRVTYWAGFGSAAILMIVLSWACSVVVMRPLLNGLVPTQEKITFADRFKRQAEAIPNTVIIIMGLFSLMLFAAGALVSLKAKLNVQMIFGMVVFGILSLYWVALFAAKLKLMRRISRK